MSEEFRNSAEAIDLQEYSMLYNRQRPKCNSPRVIQKEVFLERLAPVGEQRQKPAEDTCEDQIYYEQ